MVSTSVGTVVRPAAPGLVSPTASVIIVNYNGRKYLDACLSSLVEDGCGECEIILVDNASSDGSAEFAEQAHPQVRVLRNEANAGFGSAGNTGAAHANGEYLVFLNPDTVVTPGWLPRLVEALETNQRAGLATPKILLLDQPGRINTCGNEMHITGLTLCQGVGMERGALSQPSEVGAVSGASFAIRSRLFEALGGFDETFLMYMEDTDLSLRARLAGFVCLYAPQSVVYHDYSLRFGPRKTFYQERNRYLMLLKTFRWATLIVLLPGLLLAEILTWGFVLARERQHLANKAHAYAWVVTHWREVMQARRRTQSLRQVRDRDLLANSNCRLAFEQTGEGPIAHLAHWLFDPLFFVLHRATMALVWW